MSKKKKNQFNIGELVIFPKHGVGEITSTETMEIAGIKTRFYVVKMEQSKLIIRVPLDKQDEVGLRKISSKKTIVLQLVAFNREKDVFKKYLKTMNECGFKEVNLKPKGHVWRKVPSRSWQARYVKGDIPTANEVLLAHKII